MGCIEQKLGSGATELKKWYFHDFCQIYPQKAWLKQSKFTENSSSGKKYRSSSLVSVLPTPGVFST